MPISYIRGGTMVTDISKVSGIDKIVNTSKVKPAVKTDDSANMDKVNLADEAKRMADIQRTIDMVKNSPDVRLDKIEEAKKLIESGEFANKNIIDQVADKILKNMGI